MAQSASCWTRAHDKLGAEQPSAKHRRRYAGGSALAIRRACRPRHMNPVSARSRPSYPLSSPAIILPRLTVYRRELYDYAECINLAVLLQGRFPALDRILARAVDFSAWQKTDGSFRSRQLLLGWDNVPMHRWAQSQLFRSLSFLLYRNSPGHQSRFGRAAIAGYYVRNLRTI